MIAPLKYKEPPRKERFLEKIKRNKKTIKISAVLGLVSLPALGAYLGYKREKTSPNSIPLGIGIGAAITFYLSYLTGAYLPKNISEISANNITVTQQKHIEESSKTSSKVVLSSLLSIFTNYSAIYYSINPPSLERTKVDIKINDRGVPVTGTYTFPQFFDSIDDLIATDLSETAFEYVQVDDSSKISSHSPSARELYHNLCERVWEAEKYKLLTQQH